MSTATAREPPRTAEFLCEADALAGAREITSFGGWRAYRAYLGLADAGAPSTDG